MATRSPRIWVASAHLPLLVSCPPNNWRGWQIRPKLPAFSQALVVAETIAQKSLMGQLLSMRLKGSTDTFSRRIFTMQLIDTALQIGVFAIPALFAHLLIRSTIAAWSQPRQQEEVQTIALNDGLESFTTDDDRLLQIWEQTPDHDNFIVEAAIPAGEFRYATAEEAAIVETGMVAIAAYWQSRPVHNVVPFVRRKPAVVPNLDGFSIRQLKAIASAVRLPRYNSNTKAVLASRLVAEVPTDSLMQAIASITAQAA